MGTFSHFFPLRLYYSSKYIFTHQNCSKCQISHWPNPSFWVSAWRTQPWSRSTSKRWENRELGYWSFRFLLAPAATCPWGQCEGFLPRPSLWNPNFKFISLSEVREAPPNRRSLRLLRGWPQGFFQLTLLSTQNCQERQRGMTEVTLLSVRFKPKWD